MTVTGAGRRKLSSRARIAGASTMDVWRRRVGVRSDARAGTHVVTGGMPSGRVSADRGHVSCPMSQRTCPRCCASRASVTPQTIGPAETSTDLRGLSACPSVQDLGGVESSTRPQDARSASRRRGARGCIYDPLGVQSIGPTIFATSAARRTGSFTTGPLRSPTRSGGPICPKVREEATGQEGGWPASSSGQVSCS
jgi:hypothetical protein